MRTVERFAFIFGIVNLVLGGLALFSPFVKQRHSPVSRFLNRNRAVRMLPRRRQGLINTRTGELLGMMGAVNPPHAVLHSTLGAAGLATRQFSNLARPYMYVLAGLFTAMAVIGWANTGFRPGIHHVKGVAVDWKDNILHTVWAAAAWLFALRPNLGSNDFSEMVGE